MLPVAPVRLAPPADLGNAVAAGSRRAVLTESGGSTARQTVLPAYRIGAA